MSILYLLILFIYYYYYYFKKKKKEEGKNVDIVVKVGDIVEVLVLLHHQNSY
jgi:hypothetical protein